jgi:hypothetical protein
MRQHRKVEPAPSAETDRFALRRAACMEFADGEPLVCLEGHDDALLGVAEVDGEPRAVYDANAIVRRLMRRDGMDREGAWEFFEYNMAGSGAGSPIFVRRVS